MNKKVYIITSLIMLLLSSLTLSTYAQEILTLDKALAIAYNNNPYIIEAKKGVEVAKGELITVSVVPDP